MIRRFIHDDRGATAIEYGIAAAMASAALVIAAQLLGSQLLDQLELVSMIVSPAHEVDQPAGAP